MTHWLTLLLSASLLVSCGSSPAVRYFGLETVGVNYQQDGDDAPIMAVGPLRVPDYLKRTQMVRRGQGAEFIVDDFNRWAEPLDEAIHRTIASNVDGMLNNLVAIAFPTGSALDVDYRLFGRINKFEQDSGSAILDIQWGISDAAGSFVVAVRRVRYESSVGDRNDPAETAGAMSDAIAQLSRDIATEMAEVLP
jgi:uncharacterized lipoprotein YmbA